MTGDVGNPDATARTRIRAVPLSDEAPEAPEICEVIFFNQPLPYLGHSF